MLIDDFEYFAGKANLTAKTLSMDDPDRCNRTKEEWHAYPDFEYQFNSWGFRGPEYEQFLGKPVNICIGDSVAVNVGGPIEHSWCSQLAEHFDIPTINLGMNSAANDTIKLVAERACDLFDVKNTFVMYSAYTAERMSVFLHRKLHGEEFIQYPVEDDQKILYFETHRLTDAYEAQTGEAVLGWRTHLDELGIYRLPYPTQYYADNQAVVNQNRLKYTVESSYNNLRFNSDWPTYAEFINGTEPHPDMLDNFLHEYELYKDLYCNRDGYHQNQAANKIYADYFYNQWKLKNESQNTQ